MGGNSVFFHKYLIEQDLQNACQLRNYSNLDLPPQCIRAFLCKIKSRHNPSFSEGHLEDSFLLGKNIPKLLCDIYRYDSVLQKIVDLDLFKNDYFQFLLIEEKMLFDDVLKENNPCLLHLHIIRLLNLVNDNRNFCETALEVARTKVEQLDDRIYGSYKYFLYALANFGLAQTLLVKNQNRARACSELAFQFALFSEKIYAAGENELIDLLTFGKGLFKDLNFFSFEDFFRCIKQSGLINSESEKYCIQESVRRFEKMFPSDDLQDRESSSQSGFKKGSSFLD